MLEKEPAEEPMGTGTRERVSLAAWEEISGRLQRIHKGEDTLTVVLSAGTLVVDVESNEATTLIRHLKSEVDADVSILRTDDPKHPLRVTVEG